MLKCFILFLLQSFFRIGNADDVIDLTKVAFDGPKRGPEMTVEGGGNQGQQGMSSDRAKHYYVENINIVQEDIALRWPLGIVPYYFDLSSYDYVMNSRTREAMDIIEAVSCVRFTSVLLKPDNNSWIHITNPDGIRDCLHKPIYKGFEVIVYLGLECLSRREIVHTLLHAIGFRDEVTHPQRDQYIRVVWENIQPRYKLLFRRQPDEGPSKSLVEFDPMSIMQFHDRAFSRNGYATIAGLLPGLQVRPSEGLSQLDKMKLRLLFGHECNRRSVDDLLDTCKKEFRSDQPDNKTQNSEENENDLKESTPKDDVALFNYDGADHNEAEYGDGTSPRIQKDKDVVKKSGKKLNDVLISDEVVPDTKLLNANVIDIKTVNDKENTKEKLNFDDKENANIEEKAIEGSALSGAENAGDNDEEVVGVENRPRTLKDEDQGTQSENGITNAVDEDTQNLSLNPVTQDDYAIDADPKDQTTLNSNESDRDKDQKEDDDDDSSNVVIDDRIGTIAEAKRKKLKRH